VRQLFELFRVDADIDTNVVTRWYRPRPNRTNRFNDAISIQSSVTRCRSCPSNSSLFALFNVFSLLYYTHFFACSIITVLIIILLYIFFDYAQELPIHFYIEPSNVYFIFYHVTIKNVLH
jgi:hypothetical protein